MIDYPALSALDARDRIARGEMRGSEYIDGLLRRITEREGDVQAFAFLDPDFARKAAKAMEAHRGTGRALGALHGLAVGVKDIIDTVDMPTANGTPLDEGRRPGNDAAVVRRIRAAGGIVIGKTVTTELGSMFPRKTRNPHDKTRTPGGSSSGSAAAVAAGMVPLAIGTQTNGSVIRPASFCGVVGFKPSFGLIPRTGILPQASSLDTVGVFARTVEDAALLADALAGEDPADPDTRVAAAPRLLETARSEPPVRPTLAFVKGTAWEKAAPETQEGFAELVAALGDACRELKLHESYATVYPAAATLARVGHARHYGAYFDRGADQLSPFMREMITEGRRVTALDYLAARELQGALYKGLEEMFDHYDAILTPAAPGEAPPADSTGDPSFNTLWTFCGVPAISLPLLQGPNGLPVGVQVVGRRGEDARLLRTARWLYGTLTAGT